MSSFGGAAYLEKEKKHNPKALSSILKKFSSDERLKYSNHDWDVETYSDGTRLDNENYDLKLKEGWSELKDELEELSPTLYENIEKILFEESREKLKSLIVIKQNDKKLKLLKIFIELKKELKLSIKLHLDDLKKDKIDKFFTDVERFKSSLKMILKDIDAIADEDKKDVVVTAKEIDDTIEIRLVHSNSQSSKKAEELTKTIDENGGNFKMVYNNLNSLCDWSIDTICQDGNRYQIDYLYPEIDNDKPHFRKIDDTIEGFTHILRFYK